MCPAQGTLPYTRKPQAVETKFLLIDLFVSFLSTAREVTKFILQEIIMTTSDLNQNNLKTVREKKMNCPVREIWTVHLARESLVSVLKESTQIHQEYSLKLNTQQDSKVATECSPSEISPQHFNGRGLLQHFKLKSLVGTAETLAL